mgnify:FL=1
MRGRRRKKRIRKLMVLFCALIVIGVSAWYFLPEDLKGKFGFKVTLPTIEKKLKIVDQDSNERPIAVMIDNQAMALPHAGLQEAYLVYEIIAEGGITRLMALYKDRDVSLIGPVRSSRHYYLDYAMENDAIYAHYGWSERARRDIASLDINNLNGITNAPDAYWRDKTRYAPHNVFTSTENLKKEASKKGYKMTSTEDLLLNYNVDEVNLSEKDGAGVANNVTIRYSNYQTTSYVYDSENKVYLRSTNGEAHRDAVTGNQYTAKNIIVAQVGNSAFDNYGRQDLDNIGTGNGYYITNGYAIPITWSKDSRESQTVYKDTAGNEIEVNDGNTFIQIQPLNQALTIN